MPATMITKHFVLIISYRTSTKFRGCQNQRMALVEAANELSISATIPYGIKDQQKAGIPWKIDARLKSIKRIIKVWPDISTGNKKRTMRRRRLLGGHFYGQWRDGDAVALMRKLEQLWPLHWAAKEIQFEGFFKEQAQDDREQIQHEE